MPTGCENGPVGRNVHSVAVRRRRWFATAGARPAKTLLEVAARRKLPVWRTVRACSATVLHSLGRLVRITWLRLLLVLPVDAATHRLVSYIWALPAYRRCPDG